MPALQALPRSFPVKWSDNPAHSQDREVYPGLEGKARYEEAVFVGYRHDDKTGIASRFPFGFGLTAASKPRHLRRAVP